MFGKSAPKDSFSTLARSSRYVPGVGHYKERERAYTSHTVVRKQRMAYISKYSFTRTTEDEAKKKKWVPGPGAYEILPPSRGKSLS